MNTRAKNVQKVATGYIMRRPSNQKVLFMTVLNKTQLVVFAVKVLKLFGNPHNYQFWVWT